MVIDFPKCATEMLPWNGIPMTFKARLRPPSGKQQVSADVTSTGKEKRDDYQNLREVKRCTPE